MGKDGINNNGTLGAEGLPKIGGEGSVKGEDKKGKTGVAFTAFPADNRPNPYAGLNFDTNPYRNAVL